MQFEVRGLTADGALVSLPIEAPDRASAIEQARAAGVSALSAKARWQMPVLGGRSKFPLLTFSQELVSLMRAGLALPETIDAMVEKESRLETRRVLADVRDRIFEGQSLSRAMESLPASFPPLLVATVRAAEGTGDLAEALGRYIDYQQRLDLVRKKIVSASIYPAVLLAMGALVTLFLLAYVVPRFSAIYADSGRELPWLSQMLMSGGRVVDEHGWLVAGVFVAVVAGIVAGFKPLLGLLRRTISRLPGVGDRLLVYHLARFYRTLGMLLRGGTPVVPALAMVANLLPVDLRERLSQATRQVREGVSLSNAMSASNLTTPVAQRMLRVGEASGDMAGMMERIAAFHDEELARWVDWFTKLFEPALMAIIGLVIGGIVVLMYMPIFDLAGSLQ